MRKKNKKVIISAGLKNKHYWADALESKRLFYFFAWRDIVIRYKQTVIGIIWSVLQPIITMAIFVLVFAKVAKLSSIGNAPYAIVVFSALLPWQFFSNSLSSGSMSILGNTGMISKIYFPRIIIPISTMFVSMVDFILSFIVFLLLCLIYSFPISYRILFVPLFLMMTFAFSLGLTLFFSAFNVKYRDFKIIVPFLIQIGMYISPVGFSSSIVPSYLKLWYSLNPMVGIIEGFRWSILGKDVTIYKDGFVLSIVVIFITLFVGLRTFKKMEGTFADII